MATMKGIPLSKVSPAFLHANSTSHTWAFSAFAELIDNAYDPDVSASELLIDCLYIRKKQCLIFIDNGAGMDPEHLLKMLSFGFCEKDIFEKQGSHQPIGHYGNGFKSGSMRLGQDALVFTRSRTSASIGFLSQTFLKSTQADSVVVPIVTYRLPHLERYKSQESRNNLNAILQYSVYRKEEDLKAELRALEGSKTGTKIIISGLKTLQDGTFELDFSSDPTDIRCPEAHEADMTSVYNRPIQHNTSEYKRSLREYCSILFLRPRMKITIRGKRVKSKLISKALSNTETDTYKPTWLSRPMKIVFGFSCELNKSDDYGMMLYHRNRLIKAFEKVGYQKQPNGLGIGVVGVAQVDFLQPIHNKQDFNKDEKFNSVMAAFATKLNEYWNEKKSQERSQELELEDHKAPDWLWVQCDRCLRWRRLPDGIDYSLPETWFCHMNPDGTHNRCDIPEEPEDEDLAVKPTYQKTHKKKQVEKKRLQRVEMQREEEIKKRRMQEKEQELRQKEATLKAMQQAQAAASQPREGKAVNHLQKELAAAKRREEQQKRMILRMQEEKKKIENQRNCLIQAAETFTKSEGGKKEEILSHLTQVIGSLETDSGPATPISPTKRKRGEDTAAPGTINKPIKRLCIKTEEGEVLSITRNDIDEDDDKTVSPQETPSRKASFQSKSSPLRIAPGFPPPNQQTPSAVNNSKNRPMIDGSGSGGKKASVQQKPVKQSSPTSSLVKPGRQSSKKDSVTAVIDLTTDSELGEFIDVKPDLGELRSKLHDSIQTDVKPDKDVLDAAISDMGGTGGRNQVRESSGELTEAKQEVVDKLGQDTSLAPTTVKSMERSGKEKVRNAAGMDNEGRIKFGPTEDDPEYKMGIPGTFQDNLEAAMAAIQERMEKEKVGPTIEKVGPTIAADGSTGPGNGTKDSKTDKSEKNELKSDAIERGQEISETNICKEDSEHESHQDSLPETCEDATGDESVEKNKEEEGSKRIDSTGGEGSSLVKDFVPDTEEGMADSGLVFTDVNDEADDDDNDNKPETVEATSTEGECVKQDGNDSKGRNSDTENFTLENDEGGEESEATEYAKDLDTCKAIQNSCREQTDLGVANDQEDISSDLPAGEEFVHPKAPSDYNTSKPTTTCSDVCDNGSNTASDKLIAVSSLSNQDPDSLANIQQGQSVKDIHKADSKDVEQTVPDKQSLKAEENIRVISDSPVVSQKCSNGLKPSSESAQVDSVNKRDQVEIESGNDAMKGPQCNDSIVNKSLSNQMIQTDICDLSQTIDSSNQSFQTLSFNKTVSEVEVQTDLTNVSVGNSSSSSEHDLETIQELRDKLALKESKLTKIHQNIHRLLGFIVQDRDLGNADDIEQMIDDMIRVYEESSQQSQDGNEDS